LWLLLVPFMLANLASWMHPVRPTKQFAPVGAMSGLIRLFALSLTVTFMLAASTVGIDLIAWQCVDHAASCGSRHFFSNFMVKHLASQPGARVALGALIPLAALLVMGALSRQTGNNYEDFETQPEVLYTEDASGAADLDTQPDVDPTEDASGAADLGNPKFWLGSRPFQRLRSLHVCTALATIAGVVGYASRESQPLALAAFGLASLCGAAVLSPWAGRRRSLLRGEEPPRLVCIAMGQAHWFGLLLLAVSLVSASSAPRATGNTSPPSPPGLNALIAWVFLGQLALLAFYAVVTAIARVRSPVSGAQSLIRRALFRSFGAPVLATVALGLAGLYSCGLVFRVADYLGTPCRTGCADSGIVVASTYYAAAPAAVAALGATLAVFAAATWWRARRAKCCRVTVASEYGQSDCRSKRVATIAKAQASASLTDRADLFVTAFLILTIVGATLLWLCWREISVVTTSGTWLVGVLAFGLVYLGQSAYGSERKRRTVGILWDLGTFWPRAAHPFAPPCYCERVVPEFTERVRRLAQHGTVVISAHSQGSVVAAAVVHRLGRRGCENVRLLTYGSPLERLYARLFPHFFGVSELNKVRQTVGGCWRNLYRRSDPIGGPIFTVDAAAWTCGRESTETGDPLDVRLIDPEFAIPPGELVDLKPRGHSDYFHDAIFSATVTELAECAPTARAAMQQSQP
jgi:hypothetical protein